MAHDGEVVLRELSSRDQPVTLDLVPYRIDVVVIDGRVTDVRAGA